jgi:hypothetical protein
MDDLEAVKRLCSQRGDTKCAEDPNAHQRGSTSKVCS